MADPITIVLELEGGKSVKVNLEQIAQEAEKTGNKIEQSLSKTSFGKALNKDISSIVRNFTLATSAVAGFASALVLNKGIEAANQQEAAINQLNTSLKLAGTFSEEASISIQNFASALQESTAFGDEVIIQQVALARNFTKTNEEAVKLTKAATDLSVATGISLDSAVKNLGKTYAGLAGELGESIPALRTLTQEQLKAGAAIDLVTKRFGGAAQSELNTFAGATKSLSNAIGDLFEEIGGLVTNSPELVNFFKIGVQGITASIKDFGKSFNLFDDVVVKLFQIADILANQIAPVLEFTFNSFVAFGKGVLGIINTISAGFTAFVGKLGQAASKIAGFFGVDNEITQSLTAFGETSETVLNDNIDSLSKSFDGLFEFNISDKLAEKNVQLQEGLAKFVETSRLAAEQQKLVNDEVSEKLVESQATFFQSVGTLTTGFSVGFNTALTSTKKGLEDFQKAAAQIVNQGFARTISGGIQNVIQSLAKGEDVFANFGKFLLTTFGDLAIQLGSFFIAQGIATTALFKVNPPAAIIAAGAGLVALGAILKSFGGGGGASASGVGTGGGGSSPTEAGISTGGTAQTALAEPTIAQATPQTNVTVNVQGFVNSDKDELGRFIADTVTGNFERQGTRIIGATT